jgi:hypothetical protein
MTGLRRRTVVEWFRCQSKFTVMFNCDTDRFHLRDKINNVSVGEFMDHDEAVEWCFNLAHDSFADCWGVDTPTNDG